MRATAQRSLTPGILAFLFVASGCVKATYIGESLPPSEAVDVFYSEADIGREYRVIGRADISANAYGRVDAMRQRAVDEGKQHGADAVVIGALGKRVSGATTQMGVSGATTYAEHDKVISVLYVTYLADQ